MVEEEAQSSGAGPEREMSMLVEWCFNASQGSAEKKHRGAALNWQLYGSVSSQQLEDAFVNRQVSVTLNIGDDTVVDVHQMRAAPAADEKNWRAIRRVHQKYAKDAPKSIEQEQGTLPAVGDEAAVMVEVVEVDEPTPAVSIPLQYWPFTPELQ